ncbi:hypothetical protein TNCV_1340591 [Trichonephila clavipes]|nr:hypothetical protein TNCV_1340591 [Trichonephila clavipes]
MQREYALRIVGRGRSMSFSVEYKTCNQSLFEFVDCGSRVTKVSDRGWHCHEFEPSTTKDPPCRGAMPVKSVETSNVLPLVWYDEAHFWLYGYVNKQNCRIWSEANPQEYVKTPLHPEKLTVLCALWVGEILLQKR